MTPVEHKIFYTDYKTGLTFPLSLISPSYYKMLTEGGDVFGEPMYFCTFPALGMNQDGHFHAPLAPQKKGKAIEEIKMTDEWNDFSTAPRDGSAIIAITDDGTPYALRYGIFKSDPKKEGWFYLDGEEFAQTEPELSKDDLPILWKKHPTAGGWSVTKNS